MIQLGRTNSKRRSRSLTMCPLVDFDTLNRANNSSSVTHPNISTITSGHKPKNREFGLLDGSCLDFVNCHIPRFIRRSEQERVRECAAQGTCLFERGGDKCHVDQPTGSLSKTVFYLKRKFGVYITTLSAQAATYDPRHCWSSWHSAHAAMSMMIDMQNRRVISTGNGTR